MKETPIIFSTAMVQAIIDGRKTQTRRVVKSKHSDLSESNVAAQAADGSWIFWDKGSKFSQMTNRLYATGGFKCPYGQEKDLLWVRETWAKEDNRTISPRYGEVLEKFEGDVFYRASHEDNWPGPWKPSIHMPKKFARIWLEVTGVRVERVQDISETDVEWEGTPNYNKYPSGVSRNDFQILWDSINGKKHPWSSNPWVWVVEFKRTERP